MMLIEKYTDNRIRVGSIIVTQVPHIDGQGKMWQVYRVSCVYNGEYNADLIENCSGYIENIHLYPFILQNHYPFFLLKY
jgi:hypothetical protein